MRKGIAVVVLFVLVVGCAGMSDRIAARLAGVEKLDEATINSKDIYVGMSPRQVEGLLGRPDKAEPCRVDPNNFNWNYGIYQLHFGDQSLLYILKKIEQK